MEREEIKRLVRRHLEGSIPDEREPRGPVLDFISARDVDGVHRAGERSVRVSKGAIVTPLARDTATRYGIEIVCAGGEEKADMTEAKSPRKVSIGADHGGYGLKQVLAKRVESLGYEVHDVGTHSTASVDYPDMALLVARKVASGECDRGIVIDGAGIGSAMTANKVPGVRAAHCHNLFEVKNSREHNNANVLSLGARVIGEGLALEMVERWLAEPFAGGRHARRVDKIDALDRERR